MMTLSKAFDSIYGLPIFPQFNNPFIYMAYYLKLQAELSDPMPAETARTRVMRYLKDCEGESFRFYRDPARKTQRLSHDELLGLFWIRARYSIPGNREHLALLDRCAGFYECQSAKDVLLFRRNVYRFAYLRPTLALLTGLKIGFLQRLILKLALRTRLRTTNDGFSDDLRTWLMLPWYREIYTEADIPELYRGFALEQVSEMIRAEMQISVTEEFGIPIIGTSVTKELNA